LIHNILMWCFSVGGRRPDNSRSWAVHFAALISALYWVILNPCMAPAWPYVMLVCLL